MARKQDIIACSFCGKRREQISRLIAGPNGVFICDECVALCNEILTDEGITPQPPTDGAPGESHTT